MSYKKYTKKEMSNVISEMRRTLSNVADEICIIRDHVPVHDPVHALLDIELARVRGATPGWDIDDIFEEWFVEADVYKECEQRNAELVLEVADLKEKVKELQNE